MVTIVWIALATVLFCMPVALPVTPATMNYASVVFAGFMVVSAGWYWVSGRKTFVGPRGVVQGEEGVGGAEGEGDVKGEEEGDKEGDIVAGAEAEGKSGSRDVKS